LNSNSHVSSLVGKFSDSVILRLSLFTSVLIILAVIWNNTFLPMQDLPQHLYMAWIANNYDNTALGLADTYLLRDQFGPYRATYLLQRLFSFVVEPTTAVRVIVSLYVLLVAALVLNLQHQGDSGLVGWAGLLLVPAALHPMYFYGFLNFTLSIPVLVFALFDFRKLLLAEGSRRLWPQALWITALFLIHPYTLLVHIVLVVASIALLARSRDSLLRGLAIFAVCLALFFSWMTYASAGSTAAGLEALPDARMVWWPLQYNLNFMAMMFAGMRFSGGGDWLVLSLWLALIPVMAVGFWRAQTSYAVGLWLPLLATLALIGFFVLPFSVQTDARFTFFSVRMAPVFLFLAVAALTALPLHPLAGRLIAVLALCLTLSVAVLHDRVSREVADIAPVIDKMRAGETILPLISNSRSAFLDPIFFAQFHYHGVFYYHLLSPGGANPDLFHNRLMPVAFQDGKRPPRPSQRQLYRWSEYHQYYRYVIGRGLDPRFDAQLTTSTRLLAEAGGWRVYDLGERASR
jgi:hypothetical protein